MTAPGREEPTHGELWVFGYGSLMWRPGFTYSLRCKAMLRGWRRSLCIYSRHYRGTPDRPRLVLGLDRGGACPGVAFRVEAALREPTIRYLHEREQPTAVYIERMVPITLESGDRVSALTFVADRMHRQYAGRLAREAMLERVRAGAGASGDKRGLRDRDLRSPARDRRPGPRPGMAHRAPAEQVAPELHWLRRHGFEARWGAEIEAFPESGWQRRTSR